MGFETGSNHPVEKSADKTYTTHQLMKLAEMLEQKEMTFERFERVFASGLLSDIFEPDADINNRKGVREALKLGPPPQGDQNVSTTGTAVFVNYGLTLAQNDRRRQILTG